MAGLRPRVLTSVQYVQNHHLLRCSHLHYRRWLRQIVWHLSIRQPCGVEGNMGRCPTALLPMGRCLSPGRTSVSVLWGASHMLKCHRHPLGQGKEVLTWVPKGAVEQYGPGLHRHLTQLTQECSSAPLRGQRPCDGCGQCPCEGCGQNVLVESGWEFHGPLWRPFQGWRGERHARSPPVRYPRSLPCWARLGSLGVWAPEMRDLPHMEERTRHRVLRERVRSSHRKMAARRHVCSYSVRLAPRDRGDEAPPAWNTVVQTNRLHDSWCLHQRH